MIDYRETVNFCLKTFIKVLTRKFCVAVSNKLFLGREECYDVIRQSCVFPCACKLLLPNRH